MFLLIKENIFICLHDHKSNSYILGERRNLYIILNDLGLIRICACIMDINRCWLRYIYRPKYKLYGLSKFNNCLNMSFPAPGVYI